MTESIEKIKFPSFEEMYYLYYDKDLTLNEFADRIEQNLNIEIILDTEYYNIITSLDSDELRNLLKSEKIKQELDTFANGKTTETTETTKKNGKDKILYNRM